MAVRVEELAVSVPGLRAIRLAIDELFTGMKETYTISRLDAGPLTWWGRGRTWDSAPGSFQLKRPGDVHRDIARGAPTVYQLVALPAGVVEEVTGPLARVEPHLGAEDPRALPFARLHAAIDRGADRLGLDVAVAEAIAALRAVADRPNDRSRRVRHAIELLHARLGETLTLDDLAAHAAVDKFHLCRAFRAEVGMAPHAYLTRLRVTRAKELLRKGVRPSEVALRVGMCDQSLLNRHFRRLVGTTPGQFARAAG